MSYRELEIYRVSKKLALEVHVMTLALPKFEMYEEGRWASAAIIEICHLNDR